MHAAGAGINAAGRDAVIASAAKQSPGDIAPVHAEECFAALAMTAVWLTWINARMAHCRDKPQAQAEGSGHDWRRLGNQ